MNARFGFLILRPDDHHVFHHKIAELCAEVGAVDRDKHCHHHLRHAEGSSPRRQSPCRPMLAELVCATPISLATRFHFYIDAEALMAMSFYSRHATILPIRAAEYRQHFALPQHTRCIEAEIVGLDAYGRITTLKAISLDGMLRCCFSRDIPSCRWARLPPRLSPMHGHASPLPHALLFSLVYIRRQAAHAHDDEAHDASSRPLRQGHANTVPQGPPC